MTQPIAIRLLLPEDASAFAGLAAAYAGEMRHAPAPAPNVAAARRLLEDSKAEILGAFQQGTLIGFAILFDLPEAISGCRAGQIDDLYVAQSARGKRLAQHLIEAIVDIGRTRNWVHLRWLVPEDNHAAQAAYDRLAERAPWLSYAIWLNGTERW